MPSSNDIILNIPNFPYFVYNYCYLLLLYYAHTCCFERKCIIISVQLYIYRCIIAILYRYYKLVLIHRMTVYNYLCDFVTVKYYKNNVYSLVKPHSAILLLYKNSS